MKKILIPVDFSENSEAAINYACQLIENNKDKQAIDLVHVYTTHSNMYTNRQVNLGFVDPQVAIAEKNMEKALTTIKEQYPAIQCAAIFKDGNLYEEVSKLTATFDYDAIIMGTKGATGLEALFLGSNTYDVILNTKTPVLAVPIEKATFKKNRIGLLCNFKPAEIEALQQAISLVGNGFELVLIHVNRDDEKISVIDDRFKKWIEVIIAQTGVQNISYTVKSQVLYNRNLENLSSAIDSIIIDEQIDLLLITKSRKSIFRKLVEENIVKRMAYDLSIPKLFARVHASGQK